MAGEKRNAGHCVIHHFQVVDDTMAGADEGYIN